MTNSSKYWIACSGGVDSVVLLHLILQLKERTDVGILHCNFHLRKESSNQDEAFVCELAKKLNVPIRVKEFDTKQYSKDNSMNTQLAARELRYNWFDEVIQNENGIVLLAHHFDDQIETFFLQLRRGGKVKGLAGMPVFKNGYLRPFLKYSKNDLIALARKYDWKWREDISNSSNDYTRNWYRNEVLSFLNSAQFPLNDVVPLMHSFQQALAFIKSLPIPDMIPISDWFSMPIWYKEHILSEQDLGEYAATEIDRLAQSDKNKFIGNDFSTVWNEGNELIFVKEIENEHQYGLKIELVFRDQVEMNQNDLFLAASKVEGQLTNRKWQAGDRFQPLGMKGKKSIGKFLRDRKVAAHLKEKIKVLVNEQGEILGVFGFGVNERYKVDSKTKKVMRAYLIRLDYNFDKD
jgi:tRNA(Ile)-lysidine synthase